MVEAGVCEAFGVARVFAAVCKFNGVVVGDRAGTHTPRLLTGHGKSSDRAAPFTRQQGKSSDGAAPFTRQQGKSNEGAALFTRQVQVC